MKILIDMQGIQTPFSARRGVGTYIAALVREIHELTRQHDLEYLFNAEFPDEYFACLDRFSGIITRNNSRVFTQRIIENYYSANSEEKRVVESFVGAFIDSIEPDIFFSPNLQEGLHDKAVTAFSAQSGRFAQIATLHDMVPMYMESEYLADQRTRAWYKRKIRDAANCDRIVTVSETSKFDIERFLNVDPLNIEVIPNGYDAAKYKPTGDPEELERVKAFLRSNRNYILYFGGADKHKNLIRLIEAYASLSANMRKSYSLVLGGGDVTSAADVLRLGREVGLEDFLILPGYVPETLLPALIRQAYLFVFPSTHEGFGLPPLEAMACGTPTIASSTSAVGEVVGNPAATFDPFNVEDMAQHMGRALSDPDWRMSLRKQGLERASEFSWRRSAERLLALMEEQHDRRRHAGRLSVISRRVAEAVSSANARTAELTAITIAESVPEVRRRRIYLDVSSVALYGGNSGIQRVVREMSRYLPDAFQRFDAEVTLVYAAEATTEFKAVSPTSAHALSVDPDADQPVDFAPSDILVFLDLHPGLAIRMEQGIQRLRALGVIVCHVVYDILPVLMPEKFWPELQEEFYLWLQCISRSDGLLCISQTVAEQTADYLGKFGAMRPDALKIGHFPLGSDFNEGVASAQSLATRPELQGVFGDDLSFLMVGTLEPRKAHEQTILAFERAWREGSQWRLVLVGKQGWKMDRVSQYIRQHPMFGRRLFWFDDASDDLLSQIYKRADCVICASEGEGFGLPLVEAAHAKIAVIARDIPVFREVASDAAFYFADDVRPQAIQEAVTEWAESYRAGRKRANVNMRAVSWKQAARTLAQLVSKGEWPLVVRARGALDLRNPVTMSNGNLSRVGFYANEGAFIWTGARAALGFETIERYEKVNVQLECFSWRRTAFEVFVDDQRVFSAVAATVAAIHKFSLPPLPPGAHNIEVRSEAGSPQGDERVLGIALKQFRLVAIMPIKLGRWINVRDLNIQWNKFSEVEHDWRWTTDKRSMIEFNLSEDVHGASISVFGRGAQAYDASFVLDGKILSRRKLPIDAATIDLGPTDLRAGKNVLEIHIPDAQPFGKDDPRLLGLTVLEVRVGLPEIHPSLAESSLTDIGELTTSLDSCQS